MVRRTPTLLTKYAVVSLTLVVALGVLLALVLRDEVSDRTLAEARQQTIDITRLGIEPAFEPSDLETGFFPSSANGFRLGLSEAELTELDARFDDVTEGRVADVQTVDGILRINLWNDERWVVYSNHAPERGQWDVGNDLLERSLRGEEASEITELEGIGRVLAVYVPLRAPTPDAPAFTNDETHPIIGAFEVYRPYGPLAADIAAGTRRVLVAVAIGLVVIWAGLFGLVARASDRLRRSTEENLHRATHDDLTGLLDRDAWADAIDATPFGSGSILLVDLDNFSEINDVLGHQVGDEVLIRVAERLTTWTPQGAHIGRIGADTFVLHLSELVGEAEITGAAADLAAHIADPLHVEALDLALDTTVGVARRPLDGTSGDELLRAAQVALTRAKRDRDPITLYRPEIDDHQPADLELGAAVRQALDDGQFRLVYQPKVDLATASTPGVEALIRWDNPERGPISPGIFMPVVESTRLIRPLTEWVVDEAVRQAAAWRRELDLDLVVSVNLSARNAGDAGLVSVVADTLARHGLPPDRLQLELTESAVLGDTGRVTAVLEQIHATGVSVAIDDFGTGYASVGYLTELPVDVLKIDGSFVRHLLDGGDAAAVVRFSTELGRALDLEVVAEGAEDTETVEALRALGCHQVQGYVYSRPLPPDDLAAWVASRPRSTDDAIAGADR